MTLAPDQIPPYVSYRTFTTFLESLRAGIPDRIDGSVFDASFSGTSRKQITSALKSLNLVDDDLRPTAMLKILVESATEERREAWLELLQETYAPVFHLDLGLATPLQLREQLRKIVRTESMLVKCESFFKHAATDAGIRLSPHITKRKLPARRKKAEPRTAETADDSASAPGAVADATPPAAPGSSAENVWQLFPNFNPNWSAEERENWLAGIERVAMASRAEGPMTSETPSDGAAS